MAFPVGDYKVHLSDHDGNLLAIFDNFLRLEYGRYVNRTGYYIMILDGNDERIDLFQLDYQVQVYRRDVNSVLDWYIDFDGFHRTGKRETKDDGTLTYTTSGVDLNDLLERRVVAYKAGTIRADKNAPAETAMKEYVLENCGADASTSTVVGRLVDGVMPNFSVDSDRESGAQWYGSRPFENLINVLQDIAAFAEIDFDVIRAGPASFMFITYPGLKGVDRSKQDLDPSTGKNAGGYAPVEYSIEIGTVASAQYAFDRTSESNVIVVTGEGEGSTQKAIVVSEPDLVDDSPYNQRESSRGSQRLDIPGVNPDDLVEFSMQVSGAEALRDLAAREEFIFTPLQQPSTVYKRDYDIGDKITVTYGRVTRHKRIVGITVAVEAGSLEKISLEFTDYPYVTLSTSSIIKQLAYMQQLMAKRIRQLENRDVHKEQQVQMLGIQADLGIRLPENRQILVHGTYDVVGELVIEPGGELVIW